MSAEAVTKKRGRPKKAEKTAPEQSEATIVTTSKQSTRSRSTATAKASPTEPISKRTSRRKKLTDVDEIDDGRPKLLDHVDAPPSSKDPKTVMQDRPRASTILDEAKAFTKLKQSATTRGQASASKSEHRGLPNERNTLSEGSVPPTTPTDGSQSTRSISLPETKLPPTSSSSSSQPSDTIRSDDSRSSFLSSFLADTPDVIPEAPESAKISDRSAFKCHPLSVDDIVTGAGVSDLATLTAAIEQKASVKQPRPSAIPINPPKAFKSHNLNVFPDKPEQRKAEASPAQKYINPETYKLSSFKGLKADAPKATASIQSTPTLSVSSTDTKPTTQSPHIPPATTKMSQAPPQIQPKQPSPKANLKTSSSPPQPQQQPSTPRPPQPLPPTPTPSSHPTRPSLITPATPSTPAHLRPKRPTEMTPNELLKNPEFKSLRRKWTGVYVGIPVLVVTSYLLWDRLDKEEKAKGWIASAVPVEEARKRGELPKRILDDGGLKRE